jgi:hypothetical protein
LSSKASSNSATLPVPVVVPHKSEGPTHLSIFFIKTQLARFRQKNEVSSLQKYDVIFNGGFQLPEVRKEKKKKKRVLKSPDLSLYLVFSV